MYSMTLVIITLISATCTGFGPQGSVYTSTSIAVYGTEVEATKQGEACAFSILSLIALGDGSVETAAASGGITTVKTIDLVGFSVLGVYSELCSVIRGD